MPQCSLAKFVVLFPIGFPQEMRSVACIIYSQTTCCTLHLLFSHVASYLHCGRKLIFNKCADKPEQQDAGISLTQWSAYLVLFRLNVTLHHSVTTYLQHSLFRYNGYKYSSGLHSNQSRQADVACSPTHTECLREFASLKISSTIWNAWVVQIWLKKKVCCGDYTVEQNVCISLVSVQYRAYFL